MRRTEVQAWLEADAPISQLGERFLAYWRSKCPAVGFPRRRDITPDEIVPLLPYVFMLDVLRDGPAADFRFRLVGTAIVDIEGEHTGRLLSDMFPDRKAYQVLWRQYCDAAEGKIWVRHETLRWQGRDHVHYEVILAPLQDDSDAIDMLIGMAHGEKQSDNPNG